MTLHAASLCGPAPPESLVVNHSCHLTHRLKSCLHILLLSLRMLRPLVPENVNECNQQVKRSRRLKAIGGFVGQEK